MVHLSEPSHGVGAEDKIWTSYIGTMADPGVADVEKQKHMDQADYFPDEDS